MRRDSSFVRVFGMLILHFIPLAAACQEESPKREPSLPGTYRNLSFNVDGIGGSQRLMAPLTLNADHTYAWSREEGTWSWVGGKLRLSARPAWGDATVNSDLQLIFEFEKEGKKYVVTMYRVDPPAATASGPSEPAVAEPTPEPQRKPDGETSPLKSLRKVAAIETPSPATALVAFRDGTLLVGCRNDNTYRRYELSSGKPVGEFTVTPAAPEGMAAQDHDNRAMAISPDEKFLLVANYRSHTVAAIDLATKTVVHSVWTQGSPYRLRVTPAAPERVWIVHDQGLLHWDYREGKELWSGEGTDALDADKGRWCRLQGPFKEGAGYTITRVDPEGGQGGEIDLGSIELDQGGAIDFDGRRVYVLLTGVRVMVLGDGAKVEKVLALPTAPVIRFMKLSPNGDYLALWTPEVGSISTTPAPSPGMVIHRFIQVSGALTLWDLSKEAPVVVEKGVITNPLDVVFGTTGSFVAVAQGSQGVTILSP